MTIRRFRTGDLPTLIIPAVLVVLVVGKIYESSHDRPLALLAGAFIAGLVWMTMVNCDDLRHDQGADDHAPDSRTTRAEHDLVVRERAKIAEIARRLRCDEESARTLVLLAAKAWSDRKRSFDARSAGLGVREGFLTFDTQVAVGDRPVFAFRELGARTTIDVLAT